MFYNQCTTENPLLFYLESKIPEHLWGDYVFYRSNRKLRQLMELEELSLGLMWIDEGTEMLGRAIDHYYESESLCKG